LDTLTHERNLGMAKKKAIKKKPVASSADVKALRFAALFLSNHAEERECSKYYCPKEWIADWRRTAKRLLAIAKRME
jgi:hypothetical protein